ncbi:hypothetical protein NUW58_g7263 [Xylaria curta]|uniref:Uncharacterized protein n=1 Tax=Xylaria curta TaxID=42375 RepID=A0ACC1NKT8_9PEZI|nr:hypothetical protein NUW58_g7263 [Xylaria curta]
MVGVTVETDNRVHRMAVDDPVPWYRKPNLRTLYFLLFPCLMGIEMTSGFDSQIINAVQLVPAWTEYFGHPQGGYKGILASALPLGAVIGLPLIPFINDNLGRRWCVMIGSIIMIIGSLIQGFSINAPMYIIARLIIGFGLPYAIVAGSSLIGELAYPKERAVLTSLFNAAYFIGAIVASGVTYGTQLIPSDWSWRVPSLLQLSPSLLQVIFIFFIPESPRYLISKDRHEEAFQVIVKYHAEGDENSEFAKAQMAEIKTTIAIELEHSKRSWMDMISTAGNRRRLLIGSLVGIMSQLSGNVVISYYLGDILALVGFTDPQFAAKINIGNPNVVPSPVTLTSVDAQSSRSAYQARRGPETTLDEFISANMAIPIEDYTRTFAVNASSVWYTTMTFLKLLEAGNARANVEQKSQVVAVSSIGGFNKTNTGGFACFDAQSKAACTHLIKQLSVVLPQWDIRANLICPGLYPSEMSAAAIGSGPIPKSKIPLERVGDEQDMGGAILYLASRAGGYCNGTVVVTDGGRLTTFPSTF